LRSRLKRGIGAQGFSQAVQIFIRLAEVPLLLAYWGPQRYGEWLMLSAIPFYLSISDGGFATTACREMAMRSAAGDQRGTLAVFQSTWVLLIVVSIAMSLLSLLLAQLAPLGSWLHFSIMTASEVKITMLLLVVYVLVGFQGGLLNGCFWVAGCYATGMVFIAVILLFEFVGLAAAIVLGGGPIQAAGGYLIGKLLGTGLMWLGQRRVSPWLRYGLSSFSIPTLKRLCKPAFASLAFPLGNAMNIQGTRIVVGLVLGPSVVALFVPLRTLSRIVMQPATIINRLIEPELALAYGAGSDSLFQRLFSKSCQLSLWGCLAICLLVGPGAHWIFPLWTEGKVTMNWPAYLVLLGGVIVNGIWYTSLMIPYATNRHGCIAPYYLLVYGAAAVGLGFFGATRFGIGGVATALLLTEAATALLVLKISLRMTDVGLMHWLEAVLCPPAKMIKSMIR
jgi:O-antigen/teichoic acid export membrane protein